MVLPTFYLFSWINLIQEKTGLDDVDTCIDPDHWRNYRWPIDYRHNSRGYRDAEWPEDLSNVTWCFGDSFTAGIGVPFTHTWPQVLQQRIKQPCINISMDGASNEWIARKIEELSQEITPKRIIIQWSFTHRRESNELFNLDYQWERFYNDIKDSSWPDCCSVKDFDRLPQHIQKEIVTDFADEEKLKLLDLRHSNYDLFSDENRRLHYVEDQDNNAKNTVECIQRVHCAVPNTDVIHSFIPEFGTLEEQAVVVSSIQQQGLKYVPVFAKLDLGRDGYHYDVLTANYIVDQIVKLIEPVDAI